MKRTTTFVSWTRCFVFLVGLLPQMTGVLLFGLVAAAQEPTLTPADSVDHYKVYSLFPEVVPIPNVAVEDQFGIGFVNLTSLGKLDGEDLPLFLRFD